MTSQPIISLIALLFSILGFAYTMHRNRRGDVEKQEVRIDTLEKELAVIQTKMEVFWHNVKFDAASILHSPDPAKARTDYLIDHFKDGTISESELAELEQALQGWLADHDVAAGERLASAVLLGALEAERSAREVIRSMSA